MAATSAAKKKAKTRSRTVRNGARAGLMTFAFGVVTLAWPQALGIASADEDAGTSAVSSRSPSAERGYPSRAAGPRRANSTAANRARGAVPPRAAASQPARKGSLPRPTYATSTTAAAGDTIGVPNAVGIALFNSSGVATTKPLRSYVPSSGGYDTYLSISYPTLALWSKPAGILRQKKAPELAFREWLLDSGMAGQSAVTNPDAWTLNALKDVRSRLDSSALGIFSPVWKPPIGPDNLGSTYQGDGVSVTRWMGQVSQKTVNFRGPFEGIELRSYLKLTDMLATLPRATNCARFSDKRCNEIDLGAGNDVVLPGWFGDGYLRTGAGDDVILASPQVHIASFFGAYSDELNNWGRFTRTYYPTPYAVKGSAKNKLGNVFDGGDDNDLIYYDSGVAAAYGGRGDDILAPSFGSFNWAFDSLMQGIVTVKQIDTPATKKYTPIKGFGDPLNVFDEIASEGRGSGFRQENLFGISFVSGKNALLSPDTTLARSEKWGRQPLPGQNRYLFNGIAAFPESAAYRGGTAIDRSVNLGLVQDPKTGVITIDDQTVNRLGGQKLYGGEGADLIYGIDPAFYQGFRTAGENGTGLRVAFNGAGDGRQHAQVLASVDMFGGAGGDYFQLGNPRNLKPDKLAPNTSYLYRISGNSDAFGDKSLSDFGKLEGDVFEFNLTYEGDNWTSAATGAAGGSLSADKLVKAGFDATKVVNDLGKGFASLSLLAMPKFAAVASLGSFVAGLVSLRPEPETPITPASSYYRDPIGGWKQRVLIQDWDPADSIVITVDPANSKSDPESRWDNADFSFEDGPDSSNSKYLDVTYQITGDKSSERTLARLEEFKPSDSNGGWYAYNFYSGKEVPITRDNLGFFGQVSPSAEDPSLLDSYKDAYQFDVPAGTTLFRWNDRELSRLDPVRLSRMKSNSDRLVIQLDTMTLGYYWDTHYTGTEGTDEAGNTVVNGLAVDENETKLWIRTFDPATRDSTWTGYSLAQMAADPVLKANYADKATPVWKGVQPV